MNTFWKWVGIIAMRVILPTLRRVVLPFFVGYLIFGFVSMDFNPASWEAFTRFCMMFLVVVGGFFVYICDSFD